MSVEIMARLWCRDDLSSTEKLVGLALADSASDDGLCWPAVDTVAEKCSCSARSVQNAIRSLESKLLLRIHHRLNRSSYYVFNLDNLPLVKRTRRPKEPGPVEMTGAGDSPVVKAGIAEVKELHPTGESGSMTGESPAPRNVRETSLETPDSPPTPDGVGHPPQDLFGNELPESGTQLPIPEPKLEDQVQNQWAELKAKHPRVVGIRRLDDARIKKIRARATAAKGKDQTAWQCWQEIFERIEASRFLCGRKPPDRNHDRPFGLDIDYVLRPKEFLRILEGFYDDRPGDNGSYDPDTGRPLGPNEQAGRSVLAAVRSRREQSAVARAGRGTGRSDDARTARNLLASP